MRIVLSCCLLLLLALSGGVWCQTSSIVIGETNHPLIHNRTIDIPAAKRPWYKSMISFFTRSEKPVQNVNYTFPSQYTLNSSRCLITGVTVNDIDLFGNGGLAKIIDGGLGQDRVTINFVSKPGEPMHFSLKINGYCVKMNPMDSYTNTAQHAIPLNRELVNTVQPSYGWMPPSNLTLNNSSSVLMQNITSTSNSSGWWHFG
ncbi:uncharacterized protein LOC129576715 [Sitodiplosis mosellana]|uniref:uncharacterized protein LOC129576715 n=1 Tax=Sitodiplosis mosellana TaxID=263140 RepID=UPI0024452D0F|nr:uncharacterized protein LOC129576715 [Sitodiplosis mosellana]